MSSRSNGDADQRELELVMREAELHQFEAQLRRQAEERTELLDARELELNRREHALNVRASRLAAEERRLSGLRERQLGELHRGTNGHVQPMARIFPIPDPHRSDPREDDWWAKVLGRPQPAA